MLALLLAELSNLRYIRDMCLCREVFWRIEYVGRNRRLLTLKYDGVLGQGKEISPIFREELNLDINNVKVTAQVFH